MQTASKAFKKIIKKIETEGNESQPRDFKVKEIYFQMIPINPLYPIAHFKECNANFKYLAGEFCWYLKKETNLNIINNFSGFWQNITNEDGTVNSNYGNLILGKQLRWVYDSLTNDINSRQAIAFLNQPKFQYKRNKDFVCTMYLNFFIRNNTLNMKMTIRSNDIVFGYRYDVPWFCFILQYMYLWLKESKYPNLKLGTYYHYVDNIHFYERHFDLIERIKNTQESEEIKEPYFEVFASPFEIDKNGNYKLTEIGEEFCNNVIKLGNNKEKEQLIYKKQFEKFIKII